MPAAGKKNVKKDAGKDVKKSVKKKGSKPKSPRCRTCGKAIRVPAGWSHGPAVRRHYWAKHRAVMQKTDASR